VTYITDHVIVSLNERRELRETIYSASVELYGEFRTGTVVRRDPRENSRIDVRRKKLHSEQYLTTVSSVRSSYIDRDEYNDGNYERCWATSSAFLSPCPPRLESKYFFVAKVNSFTSRKTTTLSNRIVTNLNANFLLQACSMLNLPM